MIRKAAVLLAVFGFASCLCAQDEDAVKDRLFAAKWAYEGEWKSVHKQMGAWFDQREDAARKSGAKKLLEQVKAERAEFEDEGELPKGAPAAVRGQHEKALRALEGVYAQAARDYTKAKMDEHAAAVEAELKNISARLHGIDLLALVDLKTHVVGGDWVKTGKSLSVTTGNDHARIQLPYEPGEEYDVEIRCKRLVGTDTFGLGLVVGGRQVIAVLDSWPSRGHASGLQLVDGKEPVNDNPTTVKGRVFLDDRMSTLTYTVRKDKVEMALDGKTVFSFQGDANRLGAFTNYVPPNRKALFLFVAWHKTGVQIDSIVLIPIKGKGTILK